MMDWLATYIIGDKVKDKYDDAKDARRSSEQLAQSAADLRREQMQIALDKYNRFRTQGYRVQNEAISRLSGYEIDPDTGARRMREGGPLDASGQVRMQAGDALNAEEYAQTTAMVNQPNLAGRMTHDAMGRQNLAAASVNAANQTLGQQNRHLQGVQNVAALGQGQSLAAMQSGQQLAGQATSSALDRMASSFQRRQERVGALAGLAGAGVGAYLYGRPS